MILKPKLNIGTSAVKLLQGYETVDSGTVSIRKNRAIEMLNQIYQKEKGDLQVSSFLMQSFEDIYILEQKIRKIEEELAKEKDEKILEKLLNKYGNLQEQFIVNGGYEIQEKYQKICSGFKFTSEFLEKNYNCLSGGEKTIVNLAKILLKNPSILLLDEPTNHLDISTREILEEALQDYKGTVLLVSHDRFFVNKIVNRIVEIKDCKIQ